MGRICARDSQNMVTEPCPDKPQCTDVLCVVCGWEGHCEPADAPWVLFMLH